MDIITALTLLNQFIAQTQRLGALIAKAQEEGRQITAEELSTLTIADDAARASLQDAIDRAKAEGR